MLRRVGFGDDRYSIKSDLFVYIRILKGECLVGWFFGRFVIIYLFRFVRLFRSWEVLISLIDFCFFFNCLRIVCLVGIV